MSLGVFMAATRRLESGSYDGNYGAMGRPVKGDRARGAYQIMSKNWAPWSRQAGVGRADWRDPAAQDRVAAYWMQRYFERYGNWDLVAVAWYAGQGSADKVARRGYDGPQAIRNKHIRGYVQKIQRYMSDASTKGFDTLPGVVGDLKTSKGGWVHPVAGPSEWSKGSYMPDTLTHRGRTHAAIDVYAKAGTPIVSPVAGKVINAGKGKIGGNFVSLRGSDGNVYYFAHMGKTPTVDNGDTVQAGQHLGFVGNTGSASSTKPHLHFSIKNEQGRAVSPVSYLTAAVEAGGEFGGMSGKWMGRRGRGNLPQMMQDLVATMADQTAGGERQDYRELGLQTAEDVGDDMNVKVGTPTEEPVERKTAKDLSRGLDDDNTNL